MIIATKIMHLVLSIVIHYSQMMKYIGVSSKFHNSVLLFKSAYKLLETRCFLNFEYVFRIITVKQEKNMKNRKDISNYAAICFLETSLAIGSHVVTTCQLSLTLFCQL